MAYDLFLFDLDDTLLDFKASEKLSFARTMQELGITDGLDALYASYQFINEALWKELEHGNVTLDQLKLERFRQLFAVHSVESDPVKTSAQYLNMLSSTAVLIDQATEICAWLSQRGEIGIISNGFHHVQTKRIAHSALSPYISFISVSDACGFSKPDSRFFEYTSRMAKKFTKASTVMVGDRAEADMLGAQQFGIDGCWFNPNALSRPEHISPRYEIRHLSELKAIF